MKFRRSGQAGFTLVELMIVVAVVGLLVAIAMPAFAQARARSAKNICISNLRHIDEAKDQWALETKKGVNVQPQDEDIFGATQLIRVKPQCPVGGEYELNKIKEPPTCTIRGHRLAD